MLIVQHKNKNRCSLFCVVIFHESEGLVEYPLHKTIHMISTGDPPSPVLVIQPQLSDRKYKLKLYICKIIRKKLTANNTSWYYLWFLCYLEIYIFYS